MYFDWQQMVRPNGQRMSTPRTFQLDALGGRQVVRSYSGRKEGSLGACEKVDLLLTKMPWLVPSLPILGDVRVAGVCWRRQSRVADWS